MKVFLCFVVLFAFSNQASAVDRDHLQLSLTAEERLAADELRLSLAKLMVSLDRELITFHYQRADNFDSYRPSSWEELVRASAGWGDEFFNENNSGGDMIGPGHYVSIDLTGSRTFGGQYDPQLYVTVLKKKAKLLDVRNNFEKMGLEAFKKWHQSFSCVRGQRSSSQTADSVSQWISTYRNSDTLACRKVIIQAVADLKVDAILYGYSASNELASCRHDRGEALSILSSKSFDENQLAYFSNTQSFDPKHIAGFLNRLYDEGMQDLTLLLNLSEKEEMKPKSLASSTVLPAAYEAWKASYVYKCGPLWVNERASPVSEDFTSKIKDRDLLQAKIELKRAVTRKFPNESRGYVSFGDMRGYNEMLARLAGVSVETWASAEKKFYGVASKGAAGLAELAQVFGENCNPDINIFSVEGFEVWKSLAIGPITVFHILQKRGLSPRLAFFLINMLYSSMNGPPLVAEGLPPARNMSDAAFIASNKAVYLNYLRQCMAQVQEEGMDWAHYSAGPCGQPRQF